MTGSPAIARATSILGALSTGESLTASELASMLDLQKSSVADLCGSLAVERLIRRNHDGTFTLGQRLESLAARLAPDPRILDTFSTTVTEQPGLEGLTLTLEVLRGAETITIAARLGNQPLPLTPRPGNRSYALESAAGRAILAASDPGQLASLIAAYSEHQGITQAQRKELASLDASGKTGTELFEQAHGVRQLAAPIPPIKDRMTFAAVSAHLPVSLTDSSEVQALRAELARYAGFIAAVATTG